MNTQLVLVVDPDLDARRILSAFLEHAGYQVEQAAEAAAGLKAARQLRPAVIVGEHPLPLESGEPLCVAIHSDPAIRHIPFVAVTAHAMRTEVEDATATHDMVFTKPLDYAAVVQAIRDVAARAR
ncbi:MAG TPA: response regulator [Longimicrobiales bacterium]|nr:response regulator [Longimicrobiales bacterium]